MIRAVLDTNVLASGITHSKGHSGQLIMAWRRRAFHLIVSEHILEELAETLEDRFFKKRLTRRERQSAVTHLRRRAQLIEINEINAQVPGVSLSTKDSLVLATAESARASYVVTGDAEFRSVKEYQGIAIVSPAEFLDILKGQQVEGA